MRNIKTKQLVLLAMLAAIAYVSVLLCRIPLLTVDFLKYEPKDVVLVIGAFLFGPVSGLVLAVLVALLEMLTISSTGPIGFLMNVLSSAAFVCVASLIYQKMHRLSGAVIGLISGCLCMTGVMLLWNYLITPLYMNTLRSDVVGLLVPVFLPFNLIKSGLNTALTLLLYKPLVLGLRRLQLVDGGSGGSVKASGKIAVWVFAVLLLTTCVLLALALRGII